MATEAVATLDLTRKRGDTYADVFAVTSKATGAALDITGYSFILTVTTDQQPPDDTTKLFDIVGSITDAVNGVVEFAPSLIQSDNVGDYFYDIQMTDVATRIRTVYEGKYKMKQDRTK